jgi:hypothetical protein
MRNLFLVLVFLLMSVTLFGQPFLVCDSYPSSAPQPTSFVLTFDNSAPIEVPVYVNTDNSVQIHYDLTALSSGAHTVVAQAKDLWGVSDASAPFAFTKPAGKLGTPSNVKINVK